MNTKHTPGPWSINRYDTYDKDIVIREPGVRVDFDDVDQDEQEANARLIAAAPELLEALNAMMDGYDESYTQDQPPNKAARAAIAKATGKEPA